MSEKPKWEEQGQLSLRKLGDGRAVWIYRKIYTWPVCIGQIGDGGYDDHWCYETYAEAEAALHAWDPLKEPEPQGWFRHPQTGRRRPNGDASQEVVYG
jgi:hypothetical protein